MMIMKRFLDSLDRPVIKQNIKDRKRADPASRSIFFDKITKPSTDGDVSGSNLPLYVSSKGYFFH